LEDTKTMLQKDPLGGTNSNNNSGSGFRIPDNKTPPRLEFNKQLSQPSPTINTKEAMQVSLIIFFFIDFDIF
jgi:hypothetical protein